jgi:O-antigen/teichoic acid export membrane protein
MQRSRRVVANAAWSVLQVAVNGGLYLVLYRFLYRTIGVEQLGVWSLVLAWTSVNNVASLGLGGGTLYFIPKYLARGDRPYVTEIVETTTLTTAALIALGLLLFYPFVRLILGVVIAEPDLLSQAVSIVPYAFASVWLSTTANLVYSSIDGFQRVDLRNQLLIAGAVTFLGAAFVLVPGRGLVGLAQAQLLQAVVVLVGSWVVLRRLLPELPWLPRRWSRRAFSEVIGYSLRFQAITVTQLLFEPLTKSMLAAFGTVSLTGYFEMANRLAVQLRAFIVTAHTALLPTLTEISETTPGRLRGIYETSVRLMTFLLALLLPLLVMLAPLVSRFWLGSYEPVFIVFAMLLFAGWFGTLAGNPAYVGYMGSGALRWVVRSHVAQAVLNVVLGVALGAAYGGVGVVVGFVVALLAGSVMVAVAYSREHGSGGWSAVSADTAVLAVAALAAMGAAVAVTYRWSDTAGPWTLLAVCLALYAAVTVAPAWRHGARAQLSGWLRQYVAARRAPHA